MNQVNIIGRLTKDPESATTQSGTFVCKFSIAVDGYKGHTNFINCTSFGKTGETIAKYLKKGSQAGFTGALHQNRWQDKEGRNKSTVEILVNGFTFCGSKSDNQQQTLSGDAIVNKVQNDFDASEYTESDFTDEVPFG